MFTQLHRIVQRAAPLTIIALGLNLLSGCAHLDTPREPHDPWEGFNRSMYKFNDSLDKVVIAPAARGYRKVTPDPIEKGIGNVFDNLREIRIIVNNILQFKLVDAMSDTGRFLVNSTFGLLGWFDLARHLGMPRHDEDFGQTLGRWQAPSGPYLVLPFFGPSSVRDSVGFVVDRQIYSPISDIEDTTTRFALIALDLISLRAELLEAGDILQEAAYDPYIFIREAYLQRRRNLVYDGNPPQQPVDEEIDIFSDD